MFQLFPKGLNIPFMSLRLPTAIMSLAAVGVAVFLLMTKGINYGVDFAGGVQIVVQFDDQIDVDEEKLRASLRNIGLDGASVQKFGTEFDEDRGEFMIHFSGEFSDEEFVGAKFQQAFSEYDEGPDQPALSNFRFSGLEKAYFNLAKDIKFSEVEEKVNNIQLEMLKIQGVSPFGRATSREYEVRFQSVAANLAKSLNEEFKTPNVEQALNITKVDFVGAKVGADLKTAALLSVLVTILLVFVYIFLRFDLIYAPGVIVALAHDVIVTTGAFALMGFEFDLTVVAALLTVAGYSINDTIVVYDRIREVGSEFRGKKLLEILDIAINQTLNRTVITSATTLFATVLLWVFGGPVIHSFAFALSFGVLVGTYSSIFVASTLVYWVDTWMKAREKDNKKKVAA